VSIYGLGPYAGNFDCARHLVFREGGLDVPADLYPNEVERARAMVEGEKEPA
jgi:hypothetical protein